MYRLLTLVMICFLLILPAASFSLAQEGETTSQVSEVPVANNWGPLVFLLGFGAVAAVGAAMLANTDQGSTENGK